MKFFRFKSLQSRLLFVFASLFLTVGGLVFLLIDSVHEINAKNQIEAELNLGASVIDTFINARLEAHRQAASMLSKDYAFQQAFSKGDMETVSSAMTSLLQRTRADLMMLLSIEDSHEILVDTPGSKLSKTPFPYPDLIVKAEETEKPQSSFVNLGDQLYSIIIVPILAPDPIVCFGIGFRVDDGFLKDLKKIVPSDISIVELKRDLPAKICASTLSQNYRPEWSKRLPKTSFEKGISVISSGSDRFLVQAKLLDEKTGAWLMIQHSLEEALQPFYMLRTILMFIGICGLSITFLGSMAISRSVSKPVRELAEKSKSVARGIYNEHVMTDSEDEIGELANSFNRMTDGLLERDRMHDLLGKVVSPAIAEELLKSKEIVLGGEEKEATILFSDIRDFTTLCEGRAPSEILEMLNHYLTSMNDIIESHGGVVDKFIGDAIMALFGTPVRHGDDADRALGAALDMRKELKKINAELSAKGFPELKIGIGINTDIIVAGNMGSRNRLNYTVIGDGVNLASRLESECKKFHRNIIVSDKTLKKAQKIYNTEALGEVIVKGKKEAVPIFALLENDQTEE